MSPVVLMPLGGVLCTETYRAVTQYLDTFFIVLVLYSNIFDLKLQKNYEVKGFASTSEEYYINVIAVRSFTITENTVQPLQCMFRMFVLLH